MAELLASLDDLLARLDWELDVVEKRVASAALEDLSDDARHYGVSSWTPVTAPRTARTLVLRAAVRYMRNPYGYIQSRAGDEIVGWAPRKESGAAQFTDAEKDDLRDLGRRGSKIQVVGTYVYMHPDDKVRNCSHVPVHYHGKGFPFL